VASQDTTVERAPLYSYAASLLDLAASQLRGSVKLVTEKHASTLSASAKREVLKLSSVGASTWAASVKLGSLKQQLSQTR